MEIDKNIDEMLYKLYQNIVKSYIVGGYVRDTILNLPSNDYDIAVDAPIEKVANILRINGYTVVDASQEFGTLAVIINGEKVDIAEFRADTYDGISRQPTVRRVESIEEDLKRRDFTINSMAFEYPTGQLIDPFGGQEDLKRGILRTVRNPSVVFEEDPLRIMRAIRFASKYNMDIFPLSPSIVANKHHLSRISGERIREELLKGFSKNAVPYATLLVGMDILETIIPELKGFKTIEHDTRGHHYGESIAVHLVDTLERFKGHDAFDKLVAFLHDIGKMTTRSIDDGKIRYIGHDIEGAKMIGTALKRLKFTYREIKFAQRIIRHHLFFANLSKSTHPNKKLARFFIEQNGNMDFMLRLIEIAQADQNKDYSQYMITLFNYSMIQPVLKGSDFMDIAPNLRSKAVAKAHYYQLIGQATTKEMLKHMIMMDVREQNL